jgi:hypothetical protein
MIKRRTLLWGAGGVLALGAVAGWRVLTSSQEDAVAKVLYKRLDYLKLDPEGVRQFARDLVMRNVISSTKLRMIDATGFLYSGFALDGDSRLSLAIRRGEERVISAYLISTDFFTNGADLGKEVKYLGFFDPMRPCSNPFARLPEAFS